MSKENNNTINEDKSVDQLANDLEILDIICPHFKTLLRYKKDITTEISQ